MSDLAPPPPGHVWIWDSLKGGWLTVAEKPAPSPVVRPAADPFHMPAKRNSPLSADRPGRDRGRRGSQEDAMNTKQRANEIMADRFDCDLNRMADRAYQNREIDDRWRKIASLLDAARTHAREMMSEADRKATAA